MVGKFSQNYLVQYPKNNIFFIYNIRGTTIITPYEKINRLYVFQIFLDHNAIKPECARKICNAGKSIIPDYGAILESRDKHLRD